MHPFNFPARAAQRIRYFNGGRVVSYMPVDGRDLGNGVKEFRMLGGGDPNRCYQGVGTGAWEAGISDQPSIKVTTTFPELNSTFWSAHQPASSSVWQFGNETYEQAGVTINGLEFDLATMSFALLSCGVDRGGNGGYLFDVNPVLTPNPEIEISGNTGTVIDSTTDPVATAAGAANPTAGQLYECVTFWNHTTETLTTASRANGGAITSNDAVAGTSPDGTLVRIVGFNQKTSFDYYGMALLAFDSIPTNMQAQAFAIMGDWSRGTKNIAGVNGFTYA